MMLWLLIGCTQLPDPCSTQSGESKAYCVYKHASRLQSTKDCDAAGKWQKDCRHAWVEHRLWSTNVPASTLLQACTADEDCVLDILDVRHSTSVFEQLLWCEQAAGSLMRHCARHAMQRWRYHRKGMTEAKKLVSLNNPFAEEIGFELAQLLGCEGINQPEICNGTEDAPMICADYLRQIRQGALPCTPKRDHPQPPKEYSPLR